MSTLSAIIALSECGLQKIAFRILHLKARRPRKFDFIHRVRRADLNRLTNRARIVQQPNDIKRQLVVLRRTSGIIRKPCACQKRMKPIKISLHPDDSSVRAGCSSSALSSVRRTPFDAQCMHLRTQRALHRSFSVLCSQQFGT